MLAPGSERRAIAVRRLFSLIALLPLGAFLIAHLVTLTLALRGDRALIALVHRVHATPSVTVAEALLVLAPLVAHAAWGLLLVATRRPFAREGVYPKGMQRAVRITGVVALVFLVHHVFAHRISLAMERTPTASVPTMLASELSSASFGIPWRALAYAAGLGATIFHFAAGLFGFASGLATSPRSRVAVFVASGLLGAALFALGLNVTVYYATGSRLFGPRAETFSIESGACEPTPP